MTALPLSFFQRSAIEVAKELIGTTLVFNEVGGVIVETEAYLLEDPASHSFKGLTRRNGSMFGPPGRAYIYRSYGLHWCLNAVCLRGSAVLIRALEPTVGVPVMGVRRSCQDMRLLCSGPGRLCQALGINGSHDGLALDQEPFEILKATESAFVCVGKRIGITKALGEPWRFGLTGSNFLSRKF
jgi:DNA-3-methyladenine glycosylase